MLVLGSSLTSASSFSSSLGSNDQNTSTAGVKKVLTKDDVMEEIGVLISSVSILQGDVNEVDLSYQYVFSKIMNDGVMNRCLLGPLLYHQHQLPPHTEPAALLSSSSMNLPHSNQLTQIFHTDLSHVIHSDEQNTDCFCLYIHRSVFHSNATDVTTTSSNYPNNMYCIPSQPYDGERHCLLLDCQGMPFVFCKSFLPFMYAIYLFIYHSFDFDIIKI